MLGYNSKTLKTNGKYCEGDVVVKYEKPTASELASGTKAITSNGTHDVTGYKNATVNVGVPDGYIVPSGTKSITANGEHDVSAYAKANVNVPIPSGYIKPSGTKEITANGTHDVTNYASVNVNIVQEEPDCLIVDIDGATVGTAWQTLFKSDLIAQHIENLHCYWNCIGDDGSTSGQNIVGGRASTYPIFVAQTAGTPYYQACHHYNSARTGVTNITFTTSLVNTTTSTPSNSGFLKVETDGTVKMFVKSAAKLMACKYRFVFSW